MGGPNEPRIPSPLGRGVVNSLQNPLVKEIRKLHSAKERHSKQMFLLEGTHLVLEACAVGYPVETVCYTAQWQERYPEVWQEVSQRARREQIVSLEVLKAIATTVHPDGVVAVAKRLQMPFPTVPTSLALGLETIQDPGNLGTIIRTAAAAGATGLWVSADSVDLDHPKVLRASAGQWFRMPMAAGEDLLSLVQSCQQQGMQAIATVPDANLTYWEIDWNQPSLILLGNEGAGLSAELVALTDRQVRIPLSPGVESLNVAIAAALILYEARRQRETREF